jgi:ribosomal protein S18 acetylase RimI-like enzyme
MAERGAEVRVRRAVRADEASLVALLEAGAAELGKEAPDHAALVRGVAAFLEAEEARFLLVAEVDGVLAGALTVQGLVGATDGRPFFLVDDIVVSPAQRRAGVAGRLLAEVEAMARAAGAPRVELLVRSVNVPALTLVSRAGYRKAADVHLTLALEAPEPER